MNELAYNIRDGAVAIDQFPADVEVEEAARLAQVGRVTCESCHV